VARDTGRTISFTVKTKYRREYIERFADEAGFNNASTMARFALYQYMKRYPAKNLPSVQQMLLDEAEKEG
jgi:hypothetical protein